jgi:hypothetical protein
MKSTVIQTPPPPPAFVPVTLSLTFETFDEAAAFAALFNNPRVTRALDAAGLRDTYSAISCRLRDVADVNPSGPAYTTVDQALK